MIVWKYLNVMNGRERFCSDTCHKHMNRVSPNVFKVATYNFVCLLPPKYFFGNLGDGHVGTLNKNAPNVISK